MPSEQDEYYFTYLQYYVLVVAMIGGNLIQLSAIIVGLIVLCRLINLSKMETICASGECDEIKEDNEQHLPS